MIIYNKKKYPQLRKLFLTKSFRENICHKKLIVFRHFLSLSSELSKKIQPLIVNHKNPLR